MPEKFVSELPANSEYDVLLTDRQSSHRLSEQLAVGVTTWLRERIAHDPTVDDGYVIIRGLE